MPAPRSGESEQEFVSRFMKSAEALRDYPEEKQRAAVAYSTYREQKNRMEICPHCGAEMTGNADKLVCNACGREIHNPTPNAENLPSRCRSCPHDLENEHDDFGCKADDCPCTTKRADPSLANAGDKVCFSPTMGKSACGAQYDPVKGEPKMTTEPAMVRGCDTCMKATGAWGNKNADDSEPDKTDHLADAHEAAQGNATAEAMKEFESHLNMCNACKMEYEKEKPDLANLCNDGLNLLTSGNVRNNAGNIPKTWDEYSQEVRKLEAEGMTTSDAQGVVDASLMKAGYDPRTLERKNDGSDLEEIARHEEGIEHETKEMLAEDPSLSNASDAAVYEELQKVKAELKLLEAAYGYMSSAPDAERSHWEALAVTKAGLEKRLKDGGEKKNAEGGPARKGYDSHLDACETCRGAMDCSKLCPEGSKLYESMEKEHLNMEQSATQNAGEFQAALKKVAEVNGKSESEIRALWDKYVKTSEMYDQSPVFPEFLDQNHLKGKEFEFMNAMGIDAIKARIAEWKERAADKSVSQAERDYARTLQGQFQDDLDKTEEAQKHAASNKNADPGVEAGMRQMWDEASLSERKRTLDKAGIADSASGLVQLTWSQIPPREKSEIAKKVFDVGNQNGAGRDAAIAKSKARIKELSAKPMTPAIEAQIEEAKDDLADAMETSPLEFSSTIMTAGSRETAGASRYGSQ